MNKLSKLFDNNKKWAAKHCESDPDFFSRLAIQQNPKYLWIGCSDSRVPASDIVGLLPGELFVHRNIANLVIHTDTNCLSVLQYAVDSLKVEHVIVCGHYGCGGINAAMDDNLHGLVDNWLQHVRAIYQRHQARLMEISNESDRISRLCELNAVEQVINVGSSTSIQEAWSRGQHVTVHGWMYDLADGLLKDMEVSISSPKELELLQSKS